MPGIAGSVRRADQPIALQRAAAPNLFALPGEDAALSDPSGPLAGGRPRVSSSRFAPGPAVGPLGLGGRSASKSGVRPQRELVLTFDDGPNLETTPAVLTELGRRGLRAVFFVNGQHMVGSRPEDFARRDLIRRIATEGHLVANHTLSHRNVCADKAAMADEIDGNAEIIAGATGLRPLLFRSPYGARCRTLDQALAERDLLAVGWNLDPQEWKGGSESAIVTYVTSHLARFSGRAVLLLHDTRAETVAALPRILDWVAAENARAKRAGATPITIADYSVFLPSEPLPDSGLASFATRLGDAAFGLTGRLPRL
ncbi:MAG TPA: polysaccharide deacetylase family protein [Polyangia bacterium]